MAVSSSALLSSSTITVIVCHCRHRCHHGVVVAWCRLPPLSSSSLPSTTIATPPTTESALPCPRSPPPPVAVSPSLPSRLPMVPSWTGMRHRFPPVQCSKCRSRPRPPCRKKGQLCQRRRHGRHNALVSSPAAGVGPTFASRAAAAGQATATAAR